ncbi:amino acid ABC transporter permease [Roseomonas gilardii]|uniref:Glutamate/aspartate import permease protein GltK n=1 Tax=Roseomonas gilardii TaxID=257708 RepID=A0A1L7ALP3_9PROT|nr:amino acid ABC transporter permease [Roseomonas gilardii]APT59718.1 ABC transporter permease [Roseomonas gilardii]MDT8333943.1 amino acid ABC transporter permease [Roseomonas gilardii]PZR14585.1 MAG: amino acid ABC transporter permease [Azospirillum brasilense]
MFDVHAFLSYLTNAYLLQGVLVTVGLTIATMIVGLILGTALALMRMSQNLALTGFARFYIWIFRGTPLLVQLVLIYTGLPQVGIKLGVLPSALLALSLNEAAYLSETIRGGFKGVAKGQVEAAKALGLSVWQTLRLVQMPQVARLIIPPLGNSLNGLLKATSLASVISLEELMRRSQVLMQERFEVLELYCVAAVYYLVLTTLWNLVQVRLEAHYGRGYAETAVTGKGQPVLPRPAEAT